MDAVSVEGDAVDRGALNGSTLIIAELVFFTKSDWT